MIRTCIVNTTTAIVANVIEYDVAPIGTPPGFTVEFIAVPSDVAQIGWGWNGTAFVSPPSPAPTLAQILAAKLASGIAITSTGTPAISATYALDQTTLDQIGAVARDSAAGLGLPGGAATFTYPDINGVPRTFTGAQIQALYKAMRDCVFALYTTAATLAAGGTAVWLAQSATIP